MHWTTKAAMAVFSSTLETARFFGRFGPEGPEIAKVDALRPEIVSLVPILEIDR
jgi:hypothetical protein